METPALKTERPLDSVNSKLLVGDFGRLAVNVMRGVQSMLLIDAKQWDSEIR